MATFPANLLKFGEPHHLHCLVLTSCQRTDSGEMLPILSFPEADLYLTEQNSQTRYYLFNGCPMPQKCQGDPPSSWD